MTLTLAIFLDRIGVLRRTLPRVLPHVDGLVLLIDDRAHREVRDFADELGCPYTFHRWHDHYSDADESASFALSARLGPQPRFG